MIKDGKKCPIYTYLITEMGRDILDCTCGGKMFWYDKSCNRVLYSDIRKGIFYLDENRDIEINPDIIIDFTDMPFEDDLFSMVIFDPPHLLYAGENSWLKKKYGTLPQNWQPYIKCGFDECMRVLKPDGFLVFKWNEEQIRTADLFKIIGQRPLFGDRRSKTRWMVFNKKQ